MPVEYHNLGTDVWTWSTSAGRWRHAACLVQNHQFWTLEPMSALNTTTYLVDPIEVAVAEAVQPVTGRGGAVPRRRNEGMRTSGSYWSGRLHATVASAA
jgi:hypothetical protein